MTYTVELPLPPRELSPNFSRSPRAKIVPGAHYRAACRQLLAQLYIQSTLGKTGPLCPHGATLDYVWYLGPSPGYGKADGLYRPLDADNAIAACKKVQDAVMDAGIVAGDSHKLVTVRSVILYRAAKEHKGRCCIVLTITAKEETGE